MQYDYREYNLWLKHWAGKIFFNKMLGGPRPSTKGQGTFSGWAQQQIVGQINALFASQKSTGNKINVPNTENMGMRASLEKSKSSSFDYWVVIQNPWEKGRPIKFPANSHRALNKAIRNGWEISNQCKIKLFRGRWELVVYVSKEVEGAEINSNTLGIDVGYNYSVADSEGYLGFSTKKIHKKRIEAQRERNRQRAKFKQKQNLVKNKAKKTSTLKQLLNKEAKCIVRRSLKSGQSLVVESSRALSNLKTNRFHLWARNHLAARLKTLARENSIFLWEQWPAYSSQTCSKCSERDRKSRNRDRFNCTNCGHKDNADNNAAKVLAQWGRTALQDLLARQSPVRRAA